MLISRWSKMSLRRKKCRDLRRMFTYVMTLGESLLFKGSLANAIQLGWWQVPMRGLPSQFEELGIFRILDQGGSWISITSNWERDSSIVLVISKFLQTFWEKIFKFRTIIVYWRRSLRSGWTVICFHGSQRISWCAILCWSDVSRMDRCLSRLDNLSCSWDTWKYAGKVRPSLFLIWGD